MKVKILHPLVSLAVIILLLFCNAISGQNEFTILNNGSFIINKDTLPKDDEEITGQTILYNAERNSFRGGIIFQSDNWSPSNSGLSSFSYGFNTKAFGDLSVALGEGTQALGYRSYASGFQSIANAELSRAIGYLAEAQGIGSFASGFSSMAMGAFSYAMGYQSVASTDYSFALGNYAKAPGAQSFAMGTNAKAEGNLSTAIGRSVTSASLNSTAIGAYNIGFGDATEWNALDPILEVGNGLDTLNRSNAMTVLKNGRTIMGQQNFALQDRFTVNSQVGEPSFRVQVDNNTKLRVHANGSISLGINNTGVSANDVFIHSDLAIGVDSAEARLDVRGNSLIKMNSGTSTGAQLTLHETSTSDFARLTFKNDVPETFWTIAGRPTSDVNSSKLNFYLEGIGNVMTLTGEDQVGIGRSPNFPLHVGTDATNGNGAHLTAGGTWTNGSSRTFKENFQKVNTSSVLSAVMGLGILKWEYKGSNDGPHLGPIAEEFYEAFGLGTNEKYISTVDIDGVALAAIQALANENEVLKSENAKLLERIEAIEEKLAKFEE